MSAIAANPPALVPADIQIVPMKRKHIRGVVAIEKQVYPRPWTPNLFVSEIAEEATRSYIVAKSGNRVLGYAGLICYGDEAHITTIAVDPSLHRSKIGTRLLYDLMKIAIDRGAFAVSLEVRVSNWAAQRMYGAFGFRPVGVRRNYYVEVNEDALVMWVDSVQGAEYLDRVESIGEELPHPLRPPGADGETKT